MTPPVMLSEILREHLLRPRCAGRPAGASHETVVTNPVCGDVLHLYEARGEDGSELGFEATQACSAVLAFTSFALEHLRSLPRADWSAVDVRELVEAAGGLPPGKGHAADLFERAFTELRSASDR